RPPFAYDDPKFTAAGPATKTVKIPRGVGTIRLDGKPQWFYANAPKQYPGDLVVLPKVDGTGYVLEAALPFEAFGFQPKDGQHLLFDLALDNSTDGKSRACQLMWNGIARNSGDRTHWGRGVLGK
ncbi:MAG: hypothetical protein GW911_27425, partial [Armatimonadetes bacterium]|nr:hypothetical protein [Armatimonadota bacterium]